MKSTKLTVQSIQNEYDLAAGSFVNLLDELLSGTISPERHRNAEAIWRIMESRDRVGRTDFIYPVMHNGMSHLERFEFNRAQIELALNRKSMSTSVAYEGTPAHDFRGK